MTGNAITILANKAYCPIPRTSGALADRSDLGSDVRSRPSDLGLTRASSIDDRSLEIGDLGFSWLVGVSALVFSRNRNLFNIQKIGVRPYDRSWHCATRRRRSWDASIANTAENTKSKASIHRCRSPSLRQRNLHNRSRATDFQAKWRLSVFWLSGRGGDLCFTMRPVSMVVSRQQIISCLLFHMTRGPIWPAQDDTIATIISITQITPLTGQSMDKPEIGAKARRGQKT